MDKKFIYYILPIVIFILSGVNFFLIAAPPVEQGISNSSNPTAGESISDTLADEGAISVLDLDHSTLKFTPLDGTTQQYYTFKDAEVSKDGEKVQKSNLEVGQLVRIHYIDDGNVHIIKSIEILPSANK